MSIAEWVLLMSKQKELEVRCEAVTRNDPQELYLLIGEAIRHNLTISRYYLDDIRHKVAE